MNQGNERNIDRLYKDRRVIHRVTTSGTTSDSERQRVTTNDDKWCKS